MGGLFGVASTPATLPATVVAGDSGTLTTYAVYADQTMTVPMGTLKESYSVSNAPTSGVLVTISRTLYNTQSVSTELETKVYSLSSAGTLALVSSSDDEEATGQQYTLSASSGT